MPVGGLARHRGRGTRRCSGVGQCDEDGRDAMHDHDAEVGRALRPELFVPLTIGYNSVRLGSAAWKGEEGLWQSTEDNVINGVVHAWVIQ